MTLKLDISRRHFLQLGAGALAASSVLGRSGARRALASASSGGYKALVCLHLNGGNDGHNWVVPVSQPAYGHYAAARGDLALPHGALLPLKGAAPNGVTYGLHPSCRELQALFDSGSAAIVGNVGPLIQPTTKAQALAGSVALPPQIFSHFNQVIEWQTGVPQSVAPHGWGGKISDQFASQGITPNLSFNISLVGSNIWQQGQVTNPYTLGTSGEASLRAAGDAAYRNGLRQKATLGLIEQAAGDSNLLVNAAAGIFQSAADKVALLDNAVAAAGPVTTAFPAPQTNDWNLSLQLREVAQVIKAHQQIGDSRQLFFVEMGGFDTHYNELATQAQLLGYVSQYVDAFWSAVTEMGMQQNVTLFTMSDFGRTLTSNGAGADHGWGNHHMVLGGAVQGGRFYGSMPDLTLGGPDDFGQGRLLPTTSADQYAATLAHWFGVSDANLDSIFTNLANFPTRNLGFMV